MGAPKGVGICYCGDCTRAGFDAEGFEFVEGEPVRFESAPGILRTFCGRCGTSLTYHYEDRKRVDVATATFDDPSAFAPTTEGPQGARPAWLRGVATR